VRKSESVNVSSASRIVRDDTRKSLPRLRSVNDEWVRRALLVHSASTRQ
jgi:hypothetical protein